MQANVFLFHAGYTNDTVPILTDIWQGINSIAAVNMQVAKQQVSVKGANNSPFLNELNPFFSCYGKPVLSFRLRQ